MNYKQEHISKLAEQIKAAGYRVYISGSGTYGFYTDQAGKIVVSFQYDFGGVSVSGNYKAKNPKKHGDGWRIADDLKIESLQQYIEDKPNYLKFGIGEDSWRHSTLEEHLKQYGSSSRYVEV